MVLKGNGYHENILMHSTGLIIVLYTNIYWQWLEKRLGEQVKYAFKGNVSVDQSVRFKLFWWSTDEKTPKERARNWNLLLSTSFPTCCNLHLRQHFQFSE